MTVPRHPSRFTGSIVDALAEIALEELELVGRPIRILDPFAGTGGIHAVAVRGRIHTTGIELEPEWAQADPRTRVGNATELPWRAVTFDAVLTSPCYGNRMADHHEARDDSRRNTYRHALGRPLSDGSAAGMQWGPAYRDLHRLAWAEAWRVLRPATDELEGGLLVVNVKNHVRAGSIVRVVDWHLRTLLELGFVLEYVERIRTPGLRYGANGAARVPAEHLIAVRRPAWAELEPVIPELEIAELEAELDLADERAGLAELELEELRARLDAGSER